MIYASQKQCEKFKWPRGFVFHSVDMCALIAFIFASKGRSDYKHELDLCEFPTSDQLDTVSGINAPMGSTKGTRLMTIMWMLSTRSFRFVWFHYLNFIHFIHALMWKLYNMFRYGPVNFEPCDELKCFALHGLSCLVLVSNIQIDN